MTSAEELAALVRHLRSAASLTQRDLAGRAGLSRAVISAWEAGTSPRPPLQRALDAAARWRGACRGPPRTRR